MPTALFFMLLLDVPVAFPKEEDEKKIFEKEDIVYTLGPMEDSPIEVLTRSCEAPPLTLYIPGSYGEFAYRGFFHHLYIHPRSYGEFAYRGTQVLWGKSL